MGNIDTIRELGFEHWDALIHTFKAGSHLHGARIEGKSDLDIIGIYIQEPEDVLGIISKTGWEYSSSGSDARNNSQDIDINIKTLNEWARLACGGNPNWLAPLFVLAETQSFRKIQKNKNLFLSTSHANAFLGYAKSQFDRLQGIKGQGKHGQRQDLIDLFGYDTKMAMHMVRLMLEGIELMKKGKISYPSKYVKMLYDIRNGAYTKEGVEKTYLELEQQLKMARLDSDLPDYIDKKKVSKLIAEVYMEEWSM